MCWNMPLSVTFIVICSATVKGINGLNKASGVEFAMSLISVLLLVLGFIMFVLKILYI